MLTCPGIVRLHNGLASQLCAYAMACVFRAQMRYQHALAAIQEVEGRGVVQGEVYRVKVLKVVDFGAYVALPNGLPALLHISELSHEKIREVRDVVAEGQEFDVVCKGRDSKGFVQLSRKDLLQPPEGEQVQPADSGGTSSSTTTGFDRLDPKAAAAAAVQRRLAAAVAAATGAPSSHGSSSNSSAAAATGRPAQQQPVHSGGKYTGQSTSSSGSSKPMPPQGSPPKRVSRAMTWRPPTADSQPPPEQQEQQQQQPTVPEQGKQSE